MVMVVAMLVIMVMLVIMLLGWRCVQLLVRSLIRRCLVGFSHFSRVQINAFQKRP